MLRKADKRFNFACLKSTNNSGNLISFRLFYTLLGFHDRRILLTLFTYVYADTVSRVFYLTPKVYIIKAKVLCF